MVELRIDLTQANVGELRDFLAALDGLHADPRTPLELQGNTLVARALKVTPTMPVNTEEEPSSLPDAAINTIIEALSKRKW